ALGRERQAALTAAEEVERISMTRADLAAERQAILTRFDQARTAAAQAAGALAAATEALHREGQQEGQLRQQLIRIGGLLQQAEQTEVETLGRQRALDETETTADQELAGLE